ncbi:MAG: PrpF domain-containing protein [Rhodospirillales bacterium]
MKQTRYPAVFMRGGSSKGVFFHERDLPADPGLRDRIFLAAIGSPDTYGRQLNGMGGGVSSVSKAVMIGPPSVEGADLDYTFAQVAVDRPLVDYSSNCGNLSSAVGPFAVDEGLVKVSDGEVLIRIHNTNTKKIIHSRFRVRDGIADVGGDQTIPGVSGSGAPIRLDFLDPGGATTGRLLPTGNVIDRLDVPGVGAVEISMVDAANGCLFIDAAAVGLKGTEKPEEIEANKTAMAALDAIRRHAAVAMGLAATPGETPLANPKIAIVAKPADYETISKETVPGGSIDLVARMISMGQCHRVLPLTGGLCLGAACRMTGSVPARLPPGVGESIRLGTPSGPLTVDAEVVPDGDSWKANRASVFRTARRMMEGNVLVPEETLAAAAE